MPDSAAIMAEMNTDGERVGFGPSTYGDAFADVYDEWYGDVSDVDTTVELIHDLAGADAILELGVGTGRLALPLAARGLQVVGVDSSEAMLARLVSNDPTNSVEPIHADMADLEFDASFGVAFVAFNTLFNVTSAENQRRCFSGVARALRPAGCFVVETIVPDLDPSAADRGISPTLLDDGGVVLNVTITDKETQLVTGQHVEISPTGSVVLRPWQIRYASVGELDSMAELAGLTVEDRWETWSKATFTDDSARHVTVYRLDRTAP